MIVRQDIHYIGEYPATVQRKAPLLNFDFTLYGKNRGIFAEAFDNRETALRHLSVIPAE